MTKIRRILNIAQGVLMILFALLLIAWPAVGLPIALILISLAMLLRGARALIYYFRMARFMVSGKRILYRGIFFLDVGLFVLTLVNATAISVALYVTAGNLVGGALSLVGALDAKRQGSPAWKRRAIQGGILIALALMALVGAIFLRRSEFAVYVYALTLIYYSVILILSSFRKTAIVYIP